MASDLVFPDWQRNLVNVSATLSQYLGNQISQKTLPILEKSLQNNYRNIVYILIDGMGSRVLAKNLPTDSFLRTHQVTELTSVFPTTTVAATTTAVSAVPPAVHGWFAWALDFDGDIIELFRNRNFYTKEFTNDKNFARHQLPYRPFFLDAKTDYQVHMVMPDDIACKEVTNNYHEFYNLSQMTKTVNKICDTTGKNFIYTYYSELDSVMHTYGTTSWHARHLLCKIQKNLIKMHHHNRDTLFVVVADHGQIDLQGFDLIYQDADIQKCLVHQFSLDPRGACFKVKPGQKVAFQKAFAKYADNYLLIPSDELIAKGVFGNPFNPQYRQYLGDFIAIGGNSNRALAFNYEEQFRKTGRLYHGHHTGLTPDELFIPLIIIGDKEQSCQNCQK